MPKVVILMNAIVCGVIVFAAPSCMLIPKPKNEYKHLKGKVVQITEASSVYKSHPTITSATDPYVVTAVNQYPDLESIYIPAGHEMHVDRFKHTRTINSDHWYASGRIYIRGKMYVCAYASHHSYLELKDDAQFLPAKKRQNNSW